MKSDETTENNKLENAMIGVQEEWKQLSEQMDKYVFEPLRQGKAVDPEERRVLELRMVHLGTHLRVLSSDPPTTSYDKDAETVAREWLIEHLQEAGYNFAMSTVVVDASGSDRTTLRLSRTEHEKVVNSGYIDFDVSKKGLKLLSQHWRMGLKDVIERLKEVLDRYGFSDIDTCPVEGEIHDVEIELYEEKGW